MSKNRGVSLVLSAHRAVNADRRDAMKEHEDGLVALRNWRNRPARATEPKMPKWMAGIDALTTWKALGLGRSWPA
ncbi:MAG: hypothetical protein WAL38_06245 [Solirubrobacteraceae bacterium]